VVFKKRLVLGSLFQFYLAGNEGGRRKKEKKEREDIEEKYG